MFWPGHRRRRGVCAPSGQGASESLKSTWSETRAELLLGEHLPAPLLPPPAAEIKVPWPPRACCARRGDGPRQFLLGIDFRSTGGRHVNAPRELRSRGDRVRCGSTRAQTVRASPTIAQPSTKSLGRRGVAAAARPVAAPPRAAKSSSEAPTLNRRACAVPAVRARSGPRGRPRGGRAASRAASRLETFGPPPRHARISSRRNSVTRRDRRS